ncbi:MAG TPA: hypothetical protein VGF29_02805 [Hyphomicrobiaceae bacterium]|jgi:hypothetical protein
MHRIFAPLALAAAALGLWVLIAGPAADPFGGSPRALSEAPVAYSAWAWGLLMGLLLSWLATKDWSQLPDWLKLQRKRLGLLILGGLFASVLLLF